MGNERCPIGYLASLISVRLNSLALAIAPLTPFASRIFLTCAFCHGFRLIFDSFDRDDSCCQQDTGMVREFGTTASAATVSGGEGPSSVTGDGARTPAAAKA